VTSVLVVDDDPEQARSLKRLLTKHRPDLTILSALSGSAATEVMLKQAVDLVLTDLQMPDMDGFQLLSWVNEHCPETAVFTMSAYGTSETEQQVSQLGAYHHFVKPFDDQALVSRLQDAISQSVRGYVHNVSLASFLQLLEMERKSCTLGVVANEHRGVLVVSKGALVSARTAELEGEQAAINIVAWSEPSITISCRVEPSGLPIQSSLGFILMEGMRLQDEAARHGATRTAVSAWPPPQLSRRPGPVTFESWRPQQNEPGLPRGARGLAVVETATGHVLRAAARNDCPIGELARLASQLLVQEAATLRLCDVGEGVEELVLSTSSRCDLIKPLGEGEFALLVFSPDETNLVIARLELDHFISVHKATRVGGQG
jgi:CheY-like chemotaxis protein